MKKIYTIAAVASKQGKNIISKVEQPMTLSEARNNIHKAAKLLRENGYEDTKIVLLRHGKIAFPKLNQDLKKIKNAATGKTLWQEVQS